MTCKKCGQLNPQFARGKSFPRKNGARLLIYEGYSPGGRSFEYTGSDLCLSCRTGTRSTLAHQPVGAQLKAWLIAENRRKEV